QKSINPNFHAPALIYSEPDLAVRVIRDIFNEDFRKLTVQGSGAWDEINNYLGFIAPELVSKLEKYTGTGDLFADFRVEEQLAKAFDRKVYLPSGGSLVIDRTEAMIVIDVNTGKFIGKGGSLEETVTKNNLEAAEEIARQLRLRDLGGIIVIDFIDMVLESNREQVLRRLVECLGRDRTKHQVAEVTSLGLVQMTRKRVGQGLIEAFSTTCDSCSGRGIHIHMEPIKIKATPVPIAKEQSGESADEISEIGETTESSDLAEVEVSETPTERPAGRNGKKRRRAASSGIITPGSGSTSGA
ncbi:MAG: ribonuclease E/G, partial [Candidatus Nanopelagicaceae bacterium]|nr:ribonuclease E/G [Candidatus Nanopelagicaceae bacterium]